MSFEKLLVITVDDKDILNLKEEKEDCSPLLVESD